MIKIVVEEDKSASLFKIVQDKLQAMDFKSFQAHGSQQASDLSNFSINRDMKFITRQNERAEKAKIRTIKSIL